MTPLERAVAAISDGDIIVYPTETIYGLGGDATDAAAISAVYQLKNRPLENPLSVAVPSVAAVDRVARLTPLTREFMEAFLPGPITVVCQRREMLPDELTGGRARVGVRIPTHPLATSLLERTPPLTATSANITGAPGARTVQDISEPIREGVSTILDGGTTAGTASTVIDVDRRVIHRRGAKADMIDRWLNAHAI